MPPHQCPHGHRDPMRPVVDVSEVWSSWSDCSDQWLDCGSDVADRRSDVEHGGARYYRNCKSELKKIDQIIG